MSSLNFCVGTASDCRHWEKFVKADLTELTMVLSFLQLPSSKKVPLIASRRDDFKRLFMVCYILF
jgi:hypothetical protein